MIPLNGSENHNKFKKTSKKREMYTEVINTTLESEPYIDINQVQQKNVWEVLPSPHGIKWCSITSKDIDCGNKILEFVKKK